MHATISTTIIQVIKPQDAYRLYYTNLDERTSGVQVSDRLIPTNCNAILNDLNSIYRYIQI